MAVVRRFQGLFLALALLPGCQGGRSSPDGLQDQTLRVAIHVEPQTWNRLLASDRVTHVVTDQLHEPLLRLDPESQQMRPALAASWKFSSDGTRLTLRLRDGVRFSDGERLTARDVAFTFRALYDPRVASPLVETAQIDGSPFEIEVVDEETVVFVLPRRTATVERIFDSIPVLPAHVLEESLERGSFVADTGLGAAVGSVVGLGPFVLREHRPGERIVLERNPLYWKAAATGVVSPKLSRLVFEVVPDENARLLKFRAGEIDLLDPLTPDAFELLGKSADPSFDLVDLGPSLVTERLWFNLNPGAPLEAHKKRWFSDVRFRRAISMAIDRRAMARVVFSGRATPAAGPVSFANAYWRDATIPELAHDVEGALVLLRDAGFVRDGDGRLRDGEGRRVGFTVLTNLGSDQRSRMGAFLQEDLAKLGIEARTVPVEGGSLVARLTRSFDYEAGLLGITQTDPDPSAEMGFWLSRAPLHLWHPRQPAPATPWESRIDELMERQMTALDPEERRKSYSEVQRIVIEQLPVLDLVVPHALLGVQRRVQGLRPTPLAHSLWNAEDLFVAKRGEKATRGIGDSSH